MPRRSTSTNPTSASTFKCADTVDWPTATAVTISPTLIGRPARANNDTICTRVPSARALNHDAYSDAVTRSNGTSGAVFIVNRR